MVNLCVEYLWVSRGRLAEGVSFNNASFGELSEVIIRMWCSAEVLRILQNKSSPVLQRDSGPNGAKDSSASRVYEYQSAFFRLMKV